MLVRIWRTEVKPDRFEEYEQFARECSLALFTPPASIPTLTVTATR